MPTKPLSPYEKAARRAERAFLAYAFGPPEREVDLAARAAAHLTVLAHYSDPTEGCTCEGCMIWWPPDPPSTTHVAPET